MLLGAVDCERGREVINDLLDVLPERIPGGVEHGATRLGNQMSLAAASRGREEAEAMAQNVQVEILQAHNGQDFGIVQGIQEVGTNFA